MFLFYGRNSSFDLDTVRLIPDFKLVLFQECHKLFRLLVKANIIPQCRLIRSVLQLQVPLDYVAAIVVDV